MDPTGVPTPAPDTAPPPVIPHPGWLRPLAEGVFVLPEELRPDAPPANFINLLFSSGKRFSGLDYGVFMRLLYDPEFFRETGKFRLADAIVEFEPARQALYKGVKISSKGERAEYIFEPTQLEIIEQVAVFGAPDENGERELMGFEPKSRFVPARLDFDEFVADMWVKGVRYGIDAGAVRKAIASGETARVEIARMLAPVEGVDASIEEVYAALHRDDTPKRLTNGRHDLAQFQNRFPQVGHGTRLIRKIPRRFGKDGYDVAGKVLPPAGPPEDFDLDALCGPGVAVQRVEEGEFIVALQDGFVNLDPASNQISISEKIINQDGVSLKTTGDLHLSGDEFESHGDVQEGRLVEGKHMTLHGDVFGKILSHAGTVIIKGNIVGGEAVSARGHIQVEGRASQARLEALPGEIDVALAEGCTLIASVVRVGRAIACDILADTLLAHSVEGCAINANVIGIDESRARKDVETVIAVRVPDLAETRARIARLREESAALRQAVATRQAELAGLRGQEDFNRYLVLDMKVRKGEIKLNEAQLMQLQKAGQRHAPTLKKLRELSAEIKRLQEAATELDARIEQARAEALAQGAASHCRITAVSGATVVHRQATAPMDLALDNVTAKTLAPSLRKIPERGASRLFEGESGQLDWHPETPALDAEES